MMKKFIELLNNVDWRDMRACMCCKEACENYEGDNLEECNDCPVYASINFKMLLKELEDKV